jgi:prepilin-type N-terminal cleavage/methylation domain-containing protein
MRRDATAQHGFTLLEIIVVLSVLGALAMMLSPTAFRYIEDGNVRRTQVDAERLAIAINKMYTDTGRWPFYADGDGSGAYTAGTDAALLTSNAVCVDGECTDATLPEDDTAGDAWALGSSTIDNIANQLVTNTPFGSTDANKDYLTAGNKAWKGPYVTQLPTVDPWQNSLIVSVRNLNPAVAFGSLKWTVVISSGPNGRLETSPEALMTANPVAVGDDIIGRVR